jgi:PPM family protein phosphatase
LSSSKVRYAALTDVGAKRSHNQDACAVQLAADDPVWHSQGHIFVVADGMGGHAVGEKASAKAVRDIPHIYQKHVAQDGVVAAIRRAFTEANADIYQIGQKNPEFKGLGTTGTAIFLRPEGVWLGHVGDSRGYRIRRGKVEQLTFDHSWVWEIARRQGIDPDELGDFKKNVIVRSLGPDETVEVDIEGPHAVVTGDTFLLCSDGLTNEVAADEVGVVVSMMPPDEAAKFLIALANVRGGKDNITCIIVQSNTEDGTSTHSAVPGRGLFGSIPWPYFLLALGSLCAIVSLVLQTQALTNIALPLFGAAAVGIVLGVVGLFLHQRAATTESAHDPDAPSELHVYKAYPFELKQPMYDRFLTKENELKEVLLNHADVDWKAYQKLADTAAEKASKADWPEAIVNRCRALYALAVVFNHEFGKGEEFRPNWDKK